MSIFDSVHRRLVMNSILIGLATGIVIGAPSRASGAVIFSNLAPGPTYFFIPLNDADNARTASAIRLDTTGSSAWRVDSIAAFGVFSNAATSPSDQISVRVRIWDTFDAGASTTAFSSLLSDRTFSLGSRGGSLTGNFFTRAYTLDYLAAAAGFVVRDNTIGVDIEYFVNGGPGIGTSSGLRPASQLQIGQHLQNLYVDHLPKDGLFTSAEDYAPQFGSEFNPSLRLRISATAVPEPGSASIFALCAAVAVFRRRRRIRDSQASK